MPKRGGGCLGGGGGLLGMQLLHHTLQPKPLTCKAESTQCIGFVFTMCTSAMYSSLIL